MNHSLPSCFSLPPYLKMSSPGEKSLLLPVSSTPSLDLPLPFSGGGFNPFRSRNWGNERMKAILLPSYPSTPHASLLAISTPPLSTF